MIETVRDTIKKIMNDPISNLTKCIIYIIIGGVLAILAGGWDTELKNNGIFMLIIEVILVAFLFGGAVYAFMYIPLKIHRFSAILMPVIFVVKAIIVIYGGWALLLATLILSIVGLVKKPKTAPEQEIVEEPTQTNEE